jgi:hypothetical protein
MRAGQRTLRRSVAGLGSLALATAVSLSAQTWNDSTTLRLVQQAIQSRVRSAPDTALTSYRSRAHGLVFFLAQAGHDLTDPPRLIKADELDVDVYWQAPATSRQVILGWRDGRWLPTDINYHRDHLGIVTNNFGDRIRIGEGDEVRDALHPLAVEGPGEYDFRLRDSVLVGSRDTTLAIYEVEVRPRDPSRPGVLGVLSLDRSGGALVRFRFSFTPAAYLDPSVEDISILLENSLHEGRWWLPWRQEVEIRRRVTWLDFPARSIIRGRWEVQQYQFNAPLPAALLAGPAIGGRTTPGGSTSWTVPLADVVRGEAAPATQGDLERVRQEAERLAAGHALAGLARTRLGVPSVSDLVRVNRVQGLALGGGLSLRAGAELTLRLGASFGTSDGRLLGGMGLSRTVRGTELSLTARREVRDLGDRPLVSGVVNSLLAQEGGRDLGDYVLLDGAAAGLTLGTEGSWRLRLTGGVEHSVSVRSRATPATGHYRPNPGLGSGSIGVARLQLSRRVASLDRRASREAELRLEGGSGSRDYLRAAARAVWLMPAGPGGIEVAAQAGAGTRRLPGYRSFALGGWGTLPGEPFRAWGGRQMALLGIEYRIPLPVPALGLGPFASTGHELTLAPFLRAGWTGGSMDGLPWRVSDGARPVAGLALEWFHHLLRLEAGTSLHTGHWGLSLDVGPEWWEIL